MNCDKFNECLDNYENLSDETKQKMDKHALECANCKSELEFMRSIISTAKSLPDINVPVDFMEKLNVRIDEEEKKKARITRRVMRNVRRNWKQYTAAAACFALVAVVTANSNMFVDKMNGNDDGVIQEETVVTDSDGNTAVQHRKWMLKTMRKKINRQYLKKRLKTLFPKIKQRKVHHRLQRQSHKQVRVQIR